MNTFIRNTFLLAVLATAFTSAKPNTSQHEVGTQSEHRVYLVGGSNDFEGNVYAVNPVTGVDGPVCDDSWGFHEAKVICHELGFVGVEDFYSQSHFGDVGQSFSYDDVRCTGDESSIEDCSSSSVENCGPSEGAGVKCIPPPPKVFLVGGESDNEGNVYAVNELTGITGPICDDFWGLEDAMVVCRQLGFATAVGFYSESYFGDVIPNFSFDNFNCKGNESDILECPHSTTANCNTKESAGVRCAASLPPVALIGSRNHNEGNVYATNPTTGVFGPVCDDGWSRDEADVVCQMLGYKGAERGVIESYFGQVLALNGFSYDNVNCNYHQGTLESCDHSDGANCGLDEGAGAVCLL